MIEVTGERWWEAETYRLKGELLLMQSDENANQARQGFHRAIEIAHYLDAKLWELRAAVSLSQLMHRQGQTAEAIARLREVYDWFTDGFDAKDLQAASHQLEALSRYV